MPRATPVPFTRTGELIEKASSGDAMSGQEWHELCSVISSAPNFLIVPVTTWTTLSERLLQEQIIADGMAWLPRFGALSKLLGHPVGQQAAIDTCASLAADRANQAGIEVICMLDSTSHPDATRHVLSQLANPTSESVFYGALLASVRKLARGHFNPHQITDLMSVAVDLVVGPGGHLDSQMLAAALLRQMPEGAPVGLVNRLSRSLATNEALGVALRTGSLAPPGAAQDLIHPVVSTAVDRMPREAPWPYDETLGILLEEMIYNPISDVRLYAAILVRATPYRVPIANALAGALSRIRIASNPDLVACIVDAFRVFGTTDQRPMIERFILGQSVPSQVAIAAARNIGHIDGTSHDRFWLSAINTHAKNVQQNSSPASSAVIRGLIYGLGITGNDTLLARIQHSLALPPQARQAASWWLGQPQRIRRSALL